MSKSMHFASQKLGLLVFSSWIFSKYLKCQNVVVRWDGPMALWEKPTTAYAIGVHKENIGVHIIHTRMYRGSNFIYHL